MSLSSTHSSSPSSPNGRALDREEMLKLLANQTLAQFDIRSLSPSSHEEQSERWEGIHLEESEDENADSMLGSQEDFDDPENLHQPFEHHQSSQGSKREPEPETIVFQDPSRPLHDESKLDPTHQSERKSFMASMLKKQLNNRVGASSSSCTKNQKRKFSNQEEKKELELEKLDRSLLNLVSHLSGPTKKTRPIGLDTILSSTLPPITKDKNPQRHPRSIKTGMARAELQRSLAADKEALIHGTVRSSHAKTLTKKQKRTQDGTADRDRRERRNRTDRPLGISKGPGGMVKFSNREIKMGTSSTYSLSKKQKH